MPKKRERLEEEDPDDLTAEQFLAQVQFSVGSQLETCVLSTVHLVLTADGYIHIHNYMACDCPNCRRKIIGSLFEVAMKLSIGTDIAVDELYKNGRQKLSLLTDAVAGSA